MDMVLGHLSTLLEGCRPLDIELGKRRSGDYHCYEDGDETYDGPTLSHAVGALLSLSSEPTKEIESVEPVAEEDDDLDRDDVYAELVPDAQYVRNRCRVLKQTVHFFVIEPRRRKQKRKEESEEEVVEAPAAASTAAAVVDPMRADAAVLPTRLVTVRLAKRAVNGQRVSPNTRGDGKRGQKTNTANSEDHDVWQQTVDEIKQSNEQPSSLYEHIPYDAITLCARLMRCARVSGCIILCLVHLGPWLHHCWSRECISPRTSN